MVARADGVRPRQRRLSSKPQGRHSLSIFTISTWRRGIAALACGAAGAAMAQTGWECESFPRASGNSDAHAVAAPDGAVWTTDTAANRIIRTTADRSSTPYVPVDAATARLSGLTIGPDGALWYSKDTSSRIGRLPLAGGTGQEFELPGGRGNFPMDLSAGRDGMMWYHDPVKQAVGRVDVQGRATLFQPPAMGGKPFMTRGLAVAADGSVWVTDMGRNAVHRVDPASGEFTRFDIASPQAQPKAIVAAPDGNLWFAMPAVRMLGRITPQGAITEFPLPDTPTRLLAAADGVLWISFSGRGTVARVDTRTGKLLDTLNCGSNPGAMAMGPDGLPWILGNTRMLVIRPRGQGVAMPVVAAAPVPAPSATPAVQAAADGPAVAEMPDQEMWAALPKMPGRVVVHFSSRDPKCPYCVRGNPGFDALARQHQGDGRVSFVRVMYEPWTSVTQSVVARGIGITGLPTAIAFERGKAVKLHQGSAPADKLQAELLADLPPR